MIDASFAASNPTSQFWLRVDKSKLALIDETTRILPVVRSLQSAFSNTAANSGNNTQAATAASALAQPSHSFAALLMHLFCVPQQHRNCCTSPASSC